MKGWGEGFGGCEGAQWFGGCEGLEVSGGCEGGRDLVR